MIRLAGTMLVLAMVIWVGCSAGNRAQALADRSMEDVITEVDKLKESGLERRAQDYHDAFKQEQERMKKLRAAQEKLSYDEKTGPKAEAIQKQMKEVGRMQGRLIERLQIYIDKLHEKGVSTEAYTK